MVGTITLELEDDTGKMHSLNLEKIHYFPGEPKLLVRPHKWDRYIGEANFYREGTYSRVIDKRSILVWDNSK